MILVELLVVVVLALVQEVAFGTGLLFVWVVAGAFVREPENIFGWAFGAGMLADLLAGRHLGVSASIYLVTAGLVMVGRARVPRQSKLTVSVLVVVLLIVWELLLTGHIGWGDVVVGLICFWLFLAGAESLGRERERGTVLRLRQ